MSANPIRRRAARVAVAATLSLVLLGGCTTGQKSASNYAGAEDEFLDGCVEIAESDNGKDVDPGQENVTEIASPDDYCRCVFDALSGPDGIAFSEFKKIQSRLQDEGGPLPESFVEAYDDCDPSETGES
ncbi:hypothetical protein ACE2AJ_15975 [Aquihabitans daechungensis]|uniref:hypothetical protein n=1 Tax=Aquihabitans daechungensis TaxID=1052257 RepID=UPI003B9FBBE1